MRVSGAWGVILILYVLFAIVVAATNALAGGGPEQTAIPQEVAAPPSWQEVALEVFRTATASWQGVIMGIALIAGLSWALWVWKGRGQLAQRHRAAIRAATTPLTADERAELERYRRGDDADA